MSHDAEKLLEKKKAATPDKQVAKALPADCAPEFAQVRSPRFGDHAH